MGTFPLQARAMQQTNAELEESEKKYSELFHFTPLPMWVFDLETLYYLDANNAAIKNYGYSLAEFLTMTIKHIRPPAEMPKLKHTLRKFSSKQKLVYIGVFLHQKKNGDIIQVELRGNDIEYKGRKARIILANDITERSNYIRAIEKQNEKLRDIAWMQSHVVRAPLARVMGLIHLISDLEHSDEEKKEFLDHIMTSARELDTVIKSISEHARVVSY